MLPQYTRWSQILSARTWTFTYCYHWLSLIDDITYWVFLYFHQFDSKVYKPSVRFWRYTYSLFLGFTKGAAPSNKFLASGIGTGLCGSITTFSSFSYELNMLIVGDDCDWLWVCHVSHCGVNVIMLQCRCHPAFLIVYSRFITHMYHHHKGVPVYCNHLHWQCHYVFCGRKCC